MLNVSLGLSLACLVFCSLFTFKAWRNMNAVLLWQNAEMINASRENKLIIYKKASSCLYDNSKFLTAYAELILDQKPNSKDLEFSIGMLNRAKSNFMSKETVETLAYAYILQKNYSKAIFYFIWLKNFMPYLFEPKMALMQIYLKNRRYREAAIVGKEILLTVPKIPSSKVTQIKEDAVYLMNKYCL